MKHSAPTAQVAGTANDNAANFTVCVNFLTPSGRE
jgi:hypothetical protein